MLCIPIPILILGGAVIVFSLILRKPKYVDKCLKHSWKGCKCSLCGLEDHNWNGCICLKCGEKRYPDDRDRHELSGCVCTKCGTAFHEPVWAYRTANSCQQDQRCSRCGQVLEERVLHTPIWEQSTTNACTKEQRCSRCSTTLQVKTKHEFKKADDLKKSPCHFIKKCQQCGETQERYEHRFEFVKKFNFSDNPGTKTNSWSELFKCKQCGAEEARSDWGYTDW
jgi:hypothetical protein